MKFDVSPLTPETFRAKIEKYADILPDQLFAHVHVLLTFWGLTRLWPNRISKFHILQRRSQT